MAVLKQGGGNPYAGKVMTTNGPKDPDKRQCQACGLAKTDELFTIDANGKAVCPACAGSNARRALLGVAHRTDCEDGLCGCIDREPEDGKLDEPVLADD